MMKAILFTAIVLAICILDVYGRPHKGQHGGKSGGKDKGRKGPKLCAVELGGTLSEMEECRGNSTCEKVEFQFSFDGQDGFIYTCSNDKEENEAPETPEGAPERITDSFDVVPKEIGGMVSLF